MTLFSDGLEVGNLAAVSAGASNTAVLLGRHVDITGNGTTEQFLLPAGVQNFYASCYIVNNGSAATSDSIVVSAGGTTLVTFSSMGSANALLDNTIAGKGTVTYVASACDVVTTTAEVTANVTLTSVDTAALYRIVAYFQKIRTQID